MKSPNYSADNNTFADLLVEKYGKNGVSVEALVKKKRTESILTAEKDKTGKHHALSYEEAFDEVVADSCEDFLADSNIQQTIVEFAKADKSLASKIKEFVKGLIEKLENAIKGLHGQSAEAEFLRDFDTDELEELKSQWTSALFDARENVLQAKSKEAKESKAQKNTTGEGDVKLSVREDFAEQLQDWKNGFGKAYGKYNGSYFSLGTTSEALVKHGASKTDLIMYEDCILKVTGGKHSISLDEIAKLPYELEDPVLLFKGSVNNSFVALTEMVNKEGNDVIVAVHINKKHKRNVINKIASIYSKSDDFGNNKIINYVSKQISAGNLLDASIKKTPMWFTNRGLQLPKLVQTIISANNSILNSAQNVNTDDVKRQNRDSLIGTLNRSERSYFANSKIRNENDKVNPDDNEDTKFSLRSNVEETKDLVAVHNMQIGELKKSLDLGGLPMPSIAIIKAKSGHSEYGDVSLVFNKDTIDPQLSKDNKVYGGDAWTPVYPAIEYKANQEVAKKAHTLYYDFSKKYGYEDAKPFYNIAQDLGEELNRHNGEKGLIEYYKDDTRLMNFYLEESGKGKIDPIMKEIRTEMTETEIKQSEYLVNALGEDTIKELKTTPGESPMARRKAYFEKNGSKIENAYKNMLSELYGFSEEQIQNIISQTKTFDYVKMVNEAYKYLNNETVSVKSEKDTAATDEAIKKAAGNGYVEWLNKLLKGSEEKSGIRNNVDYFTPSGDRRSFEALHWENNLENVVRAMRGEKQTGGGTFISGMGIFGVSAKNYKSLAEIKADSDRLKHISEEEYKEIRKGFSERFNEIGESIMDKSADNPFIALDNACECVVDAIRVSKTKSGILNALRQYPQLSVSETVVDDIVNLVTDISNMPTEYFEAKPQRAVMFNEVNAVIIPDNAPQGLKERLDSMSLNVLTYEHGDNNSRTEALNSIDNVKFQDRVTPEEDAELVTYDDRSDIIPLTERFNEKSDDIRYQKRGFWKPDMPKSDFKQIERIAKAEVSSTDEYIDNITKWLYNTKNGKTYFAIYSTENETSPTILYASLDNKAVIECDFTKRILNAINSVGVTDDGQSEIGQSGAFGEILNRIGSTTDLYIVRGGESLGRQTDIGDVSVYSRTSKRRLSSALLNCLRDCFKRREQESVERIKDSLRFQDRTTQLSFEDLGIDYKNENEILKADVERLKEKLKLQGTVTHGKVLAKASYEGVAKKLLHGFGMKRVTDTELLNEFVRKLDSFYTNIIGGEELTWENVYAKSMEIAKWLENKLPEQTVCKNPYAVDILRDIRERGIMLNEKQKEEASYYAGSLSAYRKMNFGNFKIVNEGGISLTDLWEQIVSDYPGAISQEYITQGETDTNLPSVIVEVIEVMRQTESVINDENRMNYLRNMATDIYDSSTKVCKLFF